MNRNICRLDGDKVYLSLLRDDEEALQLYAEWMSDEETCVYTDHMTVVPNTPYITEWAKDTKVMRMGIVLKDCDKLIGYCHIDHRVREQVAWLSINVGDKTMRGNGIGKEVMSILLRYCFKVLGVYSVHLDVLETNIPAIKCYTSLGFQTSGRYRGHCYYERKHLDWLHMDILYDEYEVLHERV